MKRSDLIIRFMETLLLPDGTQAGQPFVLREWQKNLIREVYDPSDEQGMRIARQAILSMARKNGKSCLIAGLCLCHLCGPEAVINGQLYSMSIDREQAGILFNYAKSMVYMDEELSERLNITESRKTLQDPISGSIYSVLSGEKKGKMGKSSSFLAFDELAEFGADRTLYDALLTSTAAHKEPMTWAFSTQSPDDKAVLSELIDYGVKVNSGEIDDPTFKCFLYELSKDEDMWEEENWYKANPALGDFRSLEEMRDFARKAKRMPSMSATFQNLYLNRRIDAAANFISSDVWKANGGDPDMTAFDKYPCFGGLDLSAKNDLTALVFCTQDSDRVIHTMPFFWTPQDGLRDREDSDGAPYRLWVEQGYLTAVPGKTIDYRYVAQKLGKLHAKYNIIGIRFDRWRISDLQRALQEVGVEAYIDEKDDPISGGLKLVPHGQGFKDMNPAVELLEDFLIEEMIRHGKNPVLTMCAANVRIQSDPAGNRKFDKIKSTGRIDGMVSLAMGVVGACRKDIDLPSVYETRGILVL